MASGCVAAFVAYILHIWVTLKISWNLQLKFKTICLKWSLSDLFCNLKREKKMLLGSGWLTLHKMLLGSGWLTLHPQVTTLTSADYIYKQFKSQIRPYKKSGLTWIHTVWHSLSLSYDIPERLFWKTSIQKEFQMTKNMQNYPTCKMFNQLICVSDSDTEDTLLVDTTVLETRSLAGDSCLTSPNFSLSYFVFQIVTRKIPCWLIRQS